jgi:hypothetical protein
MKRPPKELDMNDRLAVLLCTIMVMACGKTKSPSVCPENVPPAGSECQQVGLRCTYHPDIPDEKVEAECVASQEGRLLFPRNGWSVQPPIVCINSGNEIPLDTCTNAIILSCAGDFSHDPSWWLAQDFVHSGSSSCFGCGVHANVHITLSDGCVTTLDLVDVYSVWPPEYEVVIDLTEERARGLPCLVKELQYTTVSCDFDVPCLDIEVAGQCESP